jgi:tetraacyldisaccharide 4'-kinase
MNWITPRWWYKRAVKPPLAALVLKPASWLWTTVTARRIADTQPLEPPVPVICVGNLTVGGTGKTPIVREITRRLIASGVAAHVLSRGHGGRLAGPVRVDPAIHTSADVGDEPLMLAGDLPVWICSDRPRGVIAAAEGGAQVVVMDDGHQNPWVKKALSLVVVDGETRDGEWPFGDEAVMPAGPLREPIAAGLARADGVVILLPADLAQVDSDLAALFEGKPMLIARLEAAGPPPAGPQVGFAGVGKPWKVERALKAAGCDLKFFAEFPDHQRYDAATLARLAARADALGAGLVTTEKDWVRLPPDWRERVKAWPVRARFEDEAALDSLVAKAISPRP